MPADSLRLQKELKDLAEDANSGVSVEVGDILTHLIGTVLGPKDTPYEGGIFKVDIKLTDEYPFEAPKMNFITKVWHPNVSSQSGAICLDILKDRWTPAMTLRTALLSLQSLLANPEPKDPQDAQVADQYLKNKAEFESTAGYWTEVFARENSDIDAKIGRLVEMGFDRAKVQSTLEEVGGDETAALEKLCNTL